jgi:hypothetical protein
MKELKNYIEERHSSSYKADWMSHTFQTFLGSRNTTMSSESNASIVTPAEEDNVAVGNAKSATSQPKKLPDPAKLSPPKQPALSVIRSFSKAELPSRSITLSASVGSTLNNKTVVPREGSLMLSDGGSDEVRPKLKLSNTSQMCE